MSEAIVSAEASELSEAIDSLGPGYFGDLSTASTLCHPPFLFNQVVRQRFPSARLLAAIPVVEREEVQKMKQLGAEIHYAADFSFLQSDVDLVVYRPSGYEGKAVQHMLIHQAGLHLKQGGHLLVVTHTKRGGKGLQSLMNDVFGEVEVVGRGRGGVRVLSARRESDALPSVEEPAAPIEEVIRGVPFRFLTSSSVFSKDRVDLGTRFLLEQMPLPAPGASILDLGCGYGVIGIALAKLVPQSRVTMVDVNVAAVELTKRNCALNGVDATAIAADGLDGVPLSGRLDLVVSHFPLHIEAGQLQRILEEAHEALETDGELIGIALTAYDLRRIVNQVFGNVETIARTPPDFPDPYVVIRARRRKRR